MKNLRMDSRLLLTMAPKAPNKKHVPICPWMMSPGLMPPLKRTGSVTISVNRLYPAGSATVLSYPGFSLSTHNTGFGAVVMSHSGSVNLVPSALHFSTILLTSAVQSSRHAFCPATELTNGGVRMNAFTFSTSSSFLVPNVFRAAAWTFDNGTLPSSKMAQASVAGLWCLSSSRTSLSTAGSKTFGLSTGGVSSSWSSLVCAILAAFSMAFSPSKSSISSFSSSKNSRRG
mmetsp:Transcript_3796/g.10526  ORF Transcript_3796/g.10526 Transcript_3796/m.10526 type:complete len:230 (-) Transcript_3796:628-1317(-)